MEKLKSRIEKFEYTGSLAEYQLMKPKKTYMEYEVDQYNSYQNYLYKRALYGLNALDQKELATMCSKKKHRINKVYLKGQQVINVYKQKLTIAYSNFIFKTMFPNSPITDFLVQDAETDVKFKNTLTFKVLNISKDQIISIFMEEGILPKNFMSISHDPNQLPRLKNQKL
jgi:hypothetical protein